MEENGQQLRALGYKAIRTVFTNVTRVTESAGIQSNRYAFRKYRKDNAIKRTVYSAFFHACWTYARMNAYCCTRYGIFSVTNYVFCMHLFIIVSNKQLKYLIHDCRSWGRLK